jgi:hypothetical protein
LGCRGSQHKTSGSKMTNEIFSVCDDAMARARTTGERERRSEAKERKESAMDRGPCRRFQSDPQISCSPSPNCSSLHSIFVASSFQHSFAVLSFPPHFLSFIILWTMADADSSTTFQPEGTSSPPQGGGANQNEVVDPLETAKWTRFLPESFGLREAVRQSSYRWCVREG